jgi:hypothetical protein
VERLVEELCASSEEFRALWSRHDVRPTRDDEKALVHPVLGRLHLRRHVLELSGSDQVVIAYRAEPGSDAAAALQRLAELR